MREYVCVCACAFELERRHSYQCSSFATTKAGNACSVQKSFKSKPRQRERQGVGERGERSRKKASEVASWMQFGGPESKVLLRVDT